MLPVKVIGGTLGTDDVSDYRYHNLVGDNRAFYWIGEHVYCIGKRKPTVDGFIWEQHTDQVFANLSNTILWIGKEMKRREAKKNTAGWPEWVVEEINR